MNAGLRLPAMQGAPRSRPRARGSRWWVALALMWATSVEAAGEITPLLQPGSRAALGLGGDPFLSPLLDECGWWSEPGFTTSPMARVRSVASEPLTRRATRGGGSLDFGETSVQMQYASRFAGRPLALSGRISSPRWNGTLAAAGGELRFIGEGSRAEAGVRVSELAPGLSAQASGPLWADGGARRTASLGAGLRYRPRPWLAAQASWREARIPEAFSSDLYGEPLAASLNLRSEQRRLDGRLALGGRIAVEGSVARTRYAPITPRTTLPRYEIAPTGTGALDQASAEIRITRGLAALTRWTRGSLDVAGDAVWGGERFGRLSYARADLESYLFAVEAHARGGARWVLDAERARARGRARLVLETWPFTSTLVDLLGLRRIGRVTAEAQWHRLHAGLDRPLGAAGRAQLGVAWYDVEPDASAESWRPVFLAFGKTDDRVDALGVRRAQLASVSLGGALRLGGMEGALALEQFVFARAFRTPPAPVESGNSQAAADAAPGGAKPGGWPGGTRIELTLSRRF